jgi:colanic acid/amylovoran biosynthesis glycosyltransferase
MKIAYLFNQYPSTTETFLAREVLALRRRGLNIEIFALEAGNGATKIDKAPIYMRFAEESFWRKTGEKLGRQLKAQGFTHIHAAWANHIALIAWGAAEASGLSWSFAAHARDLWVEGGNMAAKIQAAQNVFCCSTQGITQLRTYASNNVEVAKIIYAPHGIELENWPFRDWQSSSEIRLLGVGRLIEKKGWHLLIDALAETSLQGRKVNLKIIGEGPQRAALETQIQRLGLSQIELTGSLPVEAVKDQMLWANCFVLPSLIVPNSLDRDGLANVLIEAAAIGLPIITTNAGSAADLVNDDTGVLLSHPTPNEISQAVLGVFDNTRRTTTRCHNARQRVEEAFDVTKNVSVMESVFRKEAQLKTQSSCGVK